MKKLATLILSAAFMSNIGCAAKPVHKTWEALGGSKSDATVEVGFLYDPRTEAPQHSEQQALDEALKRCRAWGYQDAEPFGMARYNCQRFYNGPFGESVCTSMLYSRRYQCLDGNTTYIPKPGDPTFVGPIKPKN